MLKNTVSDCREKEWKRFHSEKRSSKGLHRGVTGSIFTDTLTTRNHTEDIMKAHGRKDTLERLGLTPAHSAHLARHAEAVADYPPKQHEFTCHLGGPDCLDQNGQPDFATCGTVHRSLATADRCAERHTRRLRSQPGYANALAYEPVSREKGWACWGAVTAEMRWGAPDRMKPSDTVPYIYFR